MKSKLLITCEHAGNKIPTAYQHLFQANLDVLNSHRGIDIGAKVLFDQFVKHANPDFSIFNEESRLLIELNRSLTHPNLFSEYTKNLSLVEKNELIDKIYIPYRQRVERFIADWIVNHTVIHLSVHSFTPIFQGTERNCDIGLLYDSRQKNEQAFCKLWKEKLDFHNQFKSRMNYPYLGKADGFTTALRKQFQQNYIGIELEVNQKHYNKGWNIAIHKIIDTFKGAYCTF